MGTLAGNLSKLESKDKSEGIQTHFWNLSYICKLHAMKKIKTNGLSFLFLSPVLFNEIQQKNYDFCTEHF